jgi:hypothetical protein
MLDVDSLCCFVFAVHGSEYLTEVGQRVMYALSKRAAASSSSGMGNQGYQAPVPGNIIIQIRVVFVPHVCSCCFPSVHPRRYSCDQISFTNIIN